MKLNSSIKPLSGASCTFHVSWVRVSTGMQMGSESAKQRPQAPAGGATVEGEFNAWGCARPVELPILEDTLWELVRFHQRVQNCIQRVPVLRLLPAIQLLCGCWAWSRHADDGQWACFKRVRWIAQPIRMGKDKWLPQTTLWSLLSWLARMMQAVCMGLLVR